MSCAASQEPTCSGHNRRNIPTTRVFLASYCSGRKVQFFFANAAQIAHKVEPLVREAQPEVVAVDASGVIDMEFTAVKMFAQLAERQSQHGVQLWLIGMTPRVLAIVQRSPLGQLLGREGMHFNLEIAVARYLDDAAVRDQY